MTDQARQRLAAAQSELVRALLAGGPVPSGFDPARVAAEVTALRAKRRRITQQLRPDLADTLGDRFTELFDTWAVDNPRRVGISARVDADEFAHWLAVQRLLTARRRWSWRWGRRR